MLDLNSLHPVGAKNLAVAVVQHAVIGFPMSTIYSIHDLSREYARRKKFIEESKLVDMVCDVSNWDPPKMKKNLLKRLKREYESAFVFISSKTIHFN